MARVMRIIDPRLYDELIAIYQANMMKDMYPNGTTIDQLNVVPNYNSVVPYKCDTLTSNTLLSRQNVLTKDEVLPKDEVLNKDESLPKVEVFNKDESLPKVEVLTKDEIIPKDESLPKVEIIPKDESLTRNTFLPQNTSLVIAKNEIFGLKKQDKLQGWKNTFLQHKKTQLAKGRSHTAKSVRKSKTVSQRRRKY